MPEYANWVVYAESALGYLAGWRNWGGDFTKNIGVASLPATLDQVTDLVAGGVSKPVSKVGYRKVARYPGSAQEAPFQGVKLT